MTDRYAVIGNPIAHSKSPQIHKMFAKQTGQDISYEAILAPRDEFAATVERLREEGFKGCNVTVPFKFEAFRLVTNLSDRARSAQAVNTLSFDAGGIYGDNTDGLGLVRDIQTNLKFPLKGRDVLLMGAGGAAYGVAWPLFDTGANLSVVNRTVEKAALMVKDFKVRAGVCLLLYEELESRKLEFDVVINATSTGLSDELLPLPPNVFARGALAYEMMYGIDTLFMKFARKHGARAVDGLGMLVEQAAESFRIWRGRDLKLDTSPVIASLRNQQ
jgi:shikimate dehydrogenase